MADERQHDARIAVLESQIEALQKVIDEIRADVKALTAWQRYLLGAAAMVGAMAATFYREISAWFKG